MNLQKQFKDETKQDAFYVNQTMWNDYYIEWLESKVEQLPTHIVSQQSEPLVLVDFANGNHKATISIRNKKIWIP